MNAHPEEGTKLLGGGIRFPGFHGWGKFGAERLENVRAAATAVGPPAHSSQPEVKLWIKTSALKSEAANLRHACELLPRFANT